MQWLNVIGFFFFERQEAEFNATQVHQPSFLAAKKQLLNIYQWALLQRESLLTAQAVLWCILIFP